MSETDAESPLFNNSLEKGLAVIRSFSAIRPDMNLPEIADAAGITKSAAQRFTFTLEALGYLKKDPKSKRYSLTPRSLDLGFGYLQANWLIDHSNSFLLDLNRKCGETVSLSEPDGTDMVFVARFTSHNFIAIHMPIGTRLPIFCTASGRAYLSALPTDEAEEILRRRPPQPYTPNTITDINEILNLVNNARKDGYAWANEEYYRGDINIAAPIRDAHGRPKGSVNVSLPTSRWTLDTGRSQIAPMLLETTRAIITSPPN